MTGFEPRTSGVSSKRFANWTTPMPNWLQKFEIESRGNRIVSTLIQVSTVVRTIRETQNSFIVLNEISAKKGASFPIT